MADTYQICTRCVMDTTDPDMHFDQGGVCYHCHAYDAAVVRRVFTGEAGNQRLDFTIGRIKREGTGKPYDCVIGVSGGVDSTFVALKVKELGLRPLAVHLDNGWDSELAANNIHQALKRLNIDLHTHVIDWEEFRDLQISFLKASTPDSEIPSDHAIVALLYQTARRLGVRYIIAGYNARTESHLPRAWSRGHMDWRYIQSVHRQFGSGRLSTYPHMGFLEYYWHRLGRRMIHLLNYIDFVKHDAIPILEKELGWQYYGGKHYESIYTRFYQGYILPRKFGYDKRRVHLSSLICSGEITRDQALAELQSPPYPAELQQDDKIYVMKKLGLTPEQFDDLMQMPRKTYWDYPSYGRIEESAPYRAARAIYRRFYRY